MDDILASTSELLLMFMLMGLPFRFAELPTVHSIITAQGLSKQGKMPRDLWVK
jgi:hypothetical protein